jgi:hypothetical protein
MSQQSSHSPLPWSLIEPVTGSDRDGVAAVRRRIAEVLHAAKGGQ